jgi:hypothetical protein
MSVIMEDEISKEEKLRLKLGATGNLIEVATINEDPIRNIFYNPEIDQFYIKGKKKVVVEVEDIKPIAWRKVQNFYIKQNGEVRSYSHQYVNLQGHRLKKDDLKTIVYKDE